MSLADQGIKLRAFDKIPSVLLLTDMFLPLTVYDTLFIEIQLPKSIYGIPYIKPKHCLEELFRERLRDRDLLTFLPHAIGSLCSQTPPTMGR